MVTVGNHGKYSRHSLFFPRKSHAHAALELREHEAGDGPAGSKSGIQYG